ncbi:MAG TPA: UPF0149 family protein [Rhodocyclaceae bacterium]|jgi:uncharacterized protein|nr:UPF0149 family protein [Rhodocyclaceae bacterium]
MSQFNARLAKPLTQAEFSELDRFLASDLTSEHTMMVDTLDGFLTAIALGPLDIPVPQWLPRVWGPEDKDVPRFRNEEQADRILALIVRQLNGILRTLQLDIDHYAPIVDLVQHDGEDYEDAEMWAFGFMAGINLARTAWQPVFENPEVLESLKPVFLLSAKNLTDEQKQQVATPQQRAALAAQLPTMVAALYTFWQPYRKAEAPEPLRVEGKVGRNETCPCGSGKKYKKCCGSEA